MKRMIWMSLAALMSLSAGTVEEDDLRAAIERDYRENLGELFVHFHRNPAAGRWASPASSSCLTPAGSESCRIPR